MKLAIITCVSNETPYLREFVAWHTLLGFNRFYIFEHENDQTPEFLAEKEFLEGLGIVTFHTAVETEVTDNIQMDNMMSALEMSRFDEVDWLMTLDLDERLVLRRHEDLPALLEALPPGADQIYFSWRIHGSNGELTYDPTRTHFEKFPRCAPDDHILHTLGKAIVRVSAAEMMDLHIHRVQGVNLNGKLEPFTKKQRYRIVAPQLEVGWVAHFAVRSRQEFEEKQQRGYAGEWHGESPRETYWEKRNRNEELAPDVSTESPPLNARLANWEGGGDDVVKTNTAVETNKRPIAANAPELTTVPESVSHWQGVRILEMMGMLAQVEGLIAALPAGEPGDTVRKGWDGKASLLRNGPAVMKLASMLNPPLTPEQMDTMFIAAGRLKL